MKPQNSYSPYIFCLYLRQIKQTFYPFTQAAQLFEKDPPKALKDTLNMLCTHLLWAHRASLQGLCQHCSTVWEPSQCSDLYQNPDSEHKPRPAGSLSVIPHGHFRPTSQTDSQPFQGNPLVTFNCTQWPSTDKCCTHEDF